MKDGADVPALTPKIKPAKDDKKGEEGKDTPSDDKTTPKRSKRDNRNPKKADEAEGKSDEPTEGEGAN